jgi:hypothetical protein
MRLSLSLTPVTSDRPAGKIPPVHNGKNPVSIRTRPTRDSHPKRKGYPDTKLEGPGRDAPARHSYFFVRASLLLPWASVE